MPCITHFYMLPHLLKLFNLFSSVEFISSPHNNAIKIRVIATNTSTNHLPSYFPNVPLMRYIRSNQFCPFVYSFVVIHL